MEELEKLKIKAGIDLSDSTQDDLLNLYLSDAEDAIKVFLNVEELESIFSSTKINLAKIYYDKCKAGSVKSESHSEGALSESVSYLIGNEFDALETALLDSLKRYRRVYVKRQNSGQES